MKRLAMVLVLGLGVLAAACREGGPAGTPLDPPSRSAAQADSTAAADSAGTGDSGTSDSRGLNTFGSGN